MTAGDHPALREFCLRAAELGFANNSSFKAMKINDVADESLAYWTLVQDGRIVGVSGCQAFPVLGHGCFRVLFRSCVLPEVAFVQGLAKSSLASSPLWKLILPLQIEWAKGLGGTHFVVTVNCDRTGLPKTMQKVGRVLRYMHKQGLLQLLHERVLLNATLQDVYLIDSESLR
jgi:hypothetical protein